ncbi:MAG: hypothetical protein EHM28_01865 [Spirochaetaceae bacterium]|nr:MAG: hypothetical protein EHM28_01865 [Spirochaetaceae bacterium]
MTKKLVLIVSLTFILIGIILIIFQISVIPDSVMGILLVVIKLWPLALIAAGIIFLRDALSRRIYIQRTESKSKTLEIPSSNRIKDILYDISFSFGSLSVSRGDAAVTRLFYEQYGSMPEPFIENSEAGSSSLLKIQKPKPFFSPHFTIRNTWNLKVAPDLPVRMDISLHESDLDLDLRGIEADTVNLHANTGMHSIRLGKSTKKTTVNVYSSSSCLSLFIPEESFFRLNLLNPFCRIDYPQGDLEKNEAGTIISSSKKNDFELIEVLVDGPLKHLVVDVID